MLDVPELKRYKSFRESQAQKRLRGPDKTKNLKHEAKHYRAFITSMFQMDPSISWVKEILNGVEEHAFAAIGQTIAYQQEVPIPKSYKAAIEDLKQGYIQKEAIQKELIALESNNTWKPVVPLRGANLVTSR